MTIHSANRKRLQEQKMWEGISQRDPVALLRFLHRIRSVRMPNGSKGKITLEEDENGLNIVVTSTFGANSATA